MDSSILSTGELQWDWKPSFIPLQDTTLLNFHNLPVFDTIAEVSRCTKFLISRVHNGDFWLDKAYPIHIEDIHNFISLSMEGKDVTQGF
jgi:hypothetical protein